MDAESKHAVTEFLGKHLDAIAYATEVAWNLREWLRECKSYPTLQSVLDSLLPHIRAELELKLIDSGLASMASGLPNKDLSAASLIAFALNLRFPHGTRIRLPHGDPPEKWITLSRYRAGIIVLRMVDEHGNRLFDANKSGDLDKIESLDGYDLKEIWEAGEASGHDEQPAPAKPTGKKPGPKTTQPPSDDAIKCYRANFVTGMTQTKLSERMTKELNRPISQGQVSRWIKQVKEWIAAGNVLPGLPVSKRENPASFDPRTLELGARRDHRTPRQRDRRSEDSDD